MKDINAYRFRIPLRSPLVLKGRRYNEREGVLLEHAGRWAEASPLPGFSRDSVEDVLDALRGDVPATPAVRFAMDSLRLPEIDVLDVPYNRLLVGTSDEVLKNARSMNDTRCKAVKLKVGRVDLCDEIRLVRSVRELLPVHVGLRLDANQAWSFEQACEFAESIADLHIEYTEEPLRDSDRLEELFDRTGMRYALDESLLEWRSLSAFPNASTLICKPTLLGGIDAIKRLAATGKPIVFSAAFESGVGMSRIVQLASEYSPETAAGLDTLDWLTDDLLIESPRKANGRFIIAGEPQVDPSCLEPISR
ncbi:MAG: o-succinylbenzoate synthase [Planctomycetota bacterium]